MKKREGEESERWRMKGKRTRKEEVKEEEREREGKSLSDNIKLVWNITRFPGS